MKVDIKDLILQIWESDEITFLDTPRSNAMRKKILRNILSLCMTDTERANMLGLPNGCRVRESAKIISPENLNCGEFVWVGENSVVDASGGLSIGDHTTIAVSALVWSHESALSNIMMDNRPGNTHIVRKNTTIGSGCYIGGPSSVYPGVTIGNNVVVLPMSVINRDIPDNVIVGGSPSKIIQKIDKKWVQQYKNKNNISNEIHL